MLIVKPAGVTKVSVHNAGMTRHDRWLNRIGSGLLFGLLSVSQPVFAASSEIAAHEAKLLGLDAGFCRRYLSNIIRYDLGAREEAGMQRFYGLARDLGLAPAGVNLEFYEARSPQPAMVEPAVGGRGSCRA